MSPIQQAKIELEELDKTVELLAPHYDIPTHIVNRKNELESFLYEALRERLFNTQINHVTA